MQDMQETWVLSPAGGNGNPPQYPLAWKIPLTEEPGGLQSVESAREWDNTEHTRRLGQSSFINTVELNAENTATPTGGNRRPSAVEKCQSLTTGPSGFPPWNRFLSVTYCLQGTEVGEEMRSHVCAQRHSSPIREEDESE